MRRLRPLQRWGPPVCAKAPRQPEWPQLKLSDGSLASLRWGQGHGSLSGRDKELGVLSSSPWEPLKFFELGKTPFVSPLAGEWVEGRQLGGRCRNAGDRQWVEKAPW